MLKKRKLAAWGAVVCLLMLAMSSVTVFAAEETTEYVPKMYASFWALVPPVVAIVLALWLAAWLVTERTLWGKYVRAIGQNSEAARIAGIRDRLTMLGVLVAASALCAVGGVILSANLRQFTPLAGQSYLMDAIAAVFIGTAFTRLGRVSILGTLGGVLFLAIIDNGLNLMGLNYLVKDALVGVILVVALALSFWQARLRQTHR